MSTKQFFDYHVHSDISSAVTNIDSVTKVSMYIEKAVEMGKKSFCFSEHGSVLNWHEKKVAIEKAGMKYVHGIEAYVTETLDEKVRDNYHTVLLAKNHEGFKEINKLMTGSFNRDDNHFYYVPRIALDDIMNTSDNIIITTACLGGLLAKGQDPLRDKFIEWLVDNKDRCFLEIQHHDVQKQIDYNNYLLGVHKHTGLQLVAGTDTHSLNQELAEARVVLQKSKNIYFDEEEGWDLTLKTYDELVAFYEKQGSLESSYYLQAIENTNLIEDMIETFEIDTSPKYPKLYDDSKAAFTKMVYEAIDTHPYALKNHTREEIVAKIEEEIPVYDKTNTIDFILFQKYVRDWEKEHGIYCGYGRGSISGSFIAYLLGITEMDSIKFDLNFFRFLNPDRVSNCDVDSDYFEPDRNAVRNFLLESPMLKSAEIITFNTIQMKGAIKDIGRALGLSVSDTQAISNAVQQDEKKNWYIEDSWKKKYPELFKWVDLVNGVIVSIGSHPAGVLCATTNIDEDIGLITLKSSDYPVSAIDMYGLDSCFYVKLDCLGLDNVGLINETCKLANIDRLTPDNVDLNDEEVWKSIAQDSSMVFQWESSFAQQIVRELFSQDTIRKIRERSPDLSLIKLFSFGNGLIRPGCASFRNDAIKGNFKDNGLDVLNNFLSQELGHISMQETIMKWLVEFCNYSPAESDNIRRAIGKKKDTTTLLPEIERRFIETTSSKYNVPVEKCAEIIKPFIQTILDASLYAFSWNHSDAYSCIGYVCAYLRHYYPIEFLTACLNIWDDNEEKTAKAIEYAGKKGYKVKEPQFRYSKSDYFFDKDTSTIYKGMRSIKFLNEKCSDDLYTLRNNQYKTFTDLLYDIKENVAINSRQLEILIKLDYFNEFGGARFLLRVYQMFSKFKDGKAKSFRRDKFEHDNILTAIMERNSTATDKSFTKMNTKAILIEVEEYMSTIDIKEFSYKERIATQIEYLGYVNLYTGLEEDRPKLIVLSKTVMISKWGDSQGKPWAVMIRTQSMGSNIKGSFTVPIALYNKMPFNETDIIYVHKWHRNQKGYFYLDKYDMVF